MMVNVMSEQVKSPSRKEMEILLAPTSHLPS
jgi:hypothetical protein